MFLSRHRFLEAAVAACAAHGAACVPAAAEGARSGTWCRELTAFAREHAYDFSLYLLDGNDVFDLGALHGRPVWLQFIATWCGPCNREAADVVRIARRYGDAIHVAAIDVEESAEKVRAFRDRHAIPFPIALDERGTVFHALGFTGLPTHVFLDARGVVSCISTGDLTPDQMDNEIAVALAKTYVVAPRAD